MSRTLNRDIKFREYSKIGPLNNLHPRETSTPGVNDVICEHWKPWPQYTTRTQNLIIWQIANLPGTSCRSLPTLPRQCRWCLFVENTFHNHDITRRIRRISNVSNLSGLVMHQYYLWVWFGAYKPGLDILNQRKANKHHHHTVPCFGFAAWAPALDVIWCRPCQTVKQLEGEFQGHQACGWYY